MKNSIKDNLFQVEYSQTLGVAVPYPLWFRVGV